jgi:hypothetical protein
MKKVLLTVLAGALAGTLFPALAADESDTFTFNGEVRARYEYLNNYFDQTDNDESGDPNDDSYSFTPYRVMVGITGNFANNVKAHADLQYVGFFGDELSPQKDFFPPIGQFDTPYNFFTQGVQLYTGWLEMTNIGETDISARLGRQEHTYGTQLFIGDNDYYAGLSFDGLRGMWTRGNNDLNLFYYKVAELNYYLPGPDGGANDSGFFGATYDYNFANGWGTVGGYALFGQDMAGGGPVFTPDTKLMTFGARWNRAMMNGDKLNMFDWNIEAAMQTGDAFEPEDAPAIDLAGYIVEAWFGFNYNLGNTHGRVHAGLLMTSGDDFDTDDEYEGFLPLYGDFHAYNRFGDLDFIEQFGLANITDINVGYEHWFGDRHYVMAAYHMFTLTEDNGAPDDDIGDEIDLTYGFQFSKNLAFQVTAGQFSPGDAFGPDADTVERVTAQAKLTW